MWDEDGRITDVNHHLNTQDFSPTLGYIPPNAKLLDVGCGRGTYLRFLKIHRSDVLGEGVDRTPEYVQICKELGLNVNLGDAENLDFKDKSFDVVTSFHVLEHLMDDRKALDKLLKIAKSRVVLILPKTITSLTQLTAIEKYHYVPYYTPLTLIRLLKGLTFRVEQHYAPTGIYESWLVVLDA